MKENKKNKLKILGFGFKSMDSFLIFLYVILFIILPISLNLEYASLGMMFIIISLIVLSIIIVYIIILIRSIKYRKTIKDKKSVVKSFAIANLIIFIIYLILYFKAIFKEILGPGPSSESPFIGFILGILFILLPIFIIMCILTLLLVIPLIIALIKSKQEKKK